MTLDLVWGRWLRLEVRCGPAPEKCYFLGMFVSLGESTRLGHEPRGRRAAPPPPRLVLPIPALETMRCTNHPHNCNATQRAHKVTRCYLPLQLPPNLNTIIPTPATMTDSFRSINVDIWEEDVLLESDLIPAYHLDPASAAAEADKKSAEARGCINR